MQKRILMIVKKQFLNIYQTNIFIKKKGLEPLNLHILGGHIIYEL